MLCRDIGPACVPLPNMPRATLVQSMNQNAARSGGRLAAHQTQRSFEGEHKRMRSVLRTIGEHPNLNAAESNRAFVLMQLFGYLRRDPNTGLDTDYSGYDFWLTKLNQFNGNFVNAEMVKAFISSSEYRQRFGP